MRPILLFIGFLPSVLIAQKTLNIQDYDELITVKDIPENQLPKNTDILQFAKNDTKTKTTIYLVARQYENEEAKIVTKFVQDAEWFNPSKSDAYFSHDTIILWSQQPFRATEIVYKLLYKNKKAKFISSEWNDPSSTAIEDAERSLAEGNIKEAVEHYEEVQYPSRYMNEYEAGFKILSKASQMALETGKKNNYKDAVQYFESALEYYVLYEFTEPKDEASMKKAFEDHYITEYTDSFGLWMSHYGSFLYLADSLDKSIETNRWLNQTYPDLMDPYIALADALYKTDKKIEAKSVYQSYINLMKVKGREKEIVQRAYERVK